MRVREGRDRPKRQGFVLMHSDAMGKGVCGGLGGGARKGLRRERKRERERHCRNEEGTKE